MLNGDYVFVHVTPTGATLDQLNRYPASVVLYSGQVSAVWRDPHCVLVDPGKGEIKFMDSLVVSNTPQGQGMTVPGT